MKKIAQTLLLLLTIISLAACNNGNTIKCSKCGGVNSDTVNFCSNCGSSLESNRNNEPSDACAHDWIYDSATVTCSKDGFIVYRCSKCNGTKQEKESAYGCYDNDNNGYCDDCNAYYSVTVEYISNRSIQYEETTKEFIFLFSLLDANELELRVNATVEMRIENNNGEIVYSSTQYVTPDNYGTWSNNFGKSWIAASIYIPTSQIKEGLSDSGIFYYRVYTDTANFDEFSLSIYGDLPKRDLTKDCFLELPSLPVVITDNSLGNYMDIKVTEMTYYFEESYDGNVELVITITGQRVDKLTGSMFDDNTSYHCNIGYKLVDSDGYTVKSGEFWTPQLAPEEKFKNVSETFYGLEPGEYTLVLIDVV